MVTTDTSASTSTSSDAGSSGGAQSDGASTTRRKLSDAQEREVTRLYAETETPVSEISKRFGIGESSVYRVAQRHGAALRGRTGAPAKPRAPRAPRTPRAAAAVSPAASGEAATGRGRRRLAQRAPADAAVRGLVRGRPSPAQRLWVRARGQGAVAERAVERELAPAPAGGVPPGCERRRRVAAGALSSASASLRRAL